MITATVQPCARYVFEGTDSLSFALFAQRLQRPNAPICTVGVDGIDTTKRDGDRRVIIGLPMGGVVDRYIRTLNVLVLPVRPGVRNAESARDELDGGELVRVGCINATMEEFAAHTVTFSLYGPSEDVQDFMAPTDYERHEANHPRAEEDDLTEALGRPGGGLVAIAIAKQLKSESAVRKLGSLLEDRGFPLSSEWAQHLTSAFLSFEGLASQNVAVCVELTEALAKFVEESVHCEEPAVVYAIESLGLVSRHYDVTKSRAARALSKVARETRDEHVRWSAFVALRAVASPHLTRHEIDDMGGALPESPGSEVGKLVRSSFTDLQDVYQSSPRYDVFLSYESGSVEWVRRLYGELSDVNVKAWFDEEEMVPARFSYVQINEGIKVSDRCVAICTPEYDTRHFTAFELGAFFDRQSARMTRGLIIPVVLGQTLQDFKTSNPGLGAIGAIVVKNQSDSEVKRVAMEIAKVVNS